MESWFAVWTRSRQEHVVCDEIASKQIPSFLPTIKRVSQWKDRRKVVAWPLFPGYCFARLPTSALSSVLTCRGVVTVLSNAEGPVAIPDEEIAGLQQLVASGLMFDACDTLDVGTPVEVVRGPLAGVTGRLISKDKGDQLVVGVDLLNSGARICVDRGDVRPI